jgi:hypothetical protein
MYVSYLMLNEQIDKGKLAIPFRESKILHSTNGCKLRIKKALCEATEKVPLMLKRYSPSRKVEEAVPFFCINKPS